ncbi:phytanoyl-CoA dioxygenase family protein [Micromonospora sp. NBC_01699]|uniref:phytanoyl-CoA dioxygenase family protein n=1 Tax=Micromonospora sp. NBC_01699 TaxID=2975984 RepID=UPI002E2EEC60|nr:phytanoyl-CoA dioxygenase family protein [Micromonospora sp. NBC_01699]
MAETADIDHIPAAAALQEDGFVVLPALLSDEQLTAAVRHADSLLHSVGWSDNDFDGRRTRRVYSLLSRLGGFEPLLIHPQVRRLVTARLGEVHQFGMLFLSAVDPGQGSQPLHFDAGVYPLPREVEAETNVIWAVDDFTVDNGATVIAPGSHRWPAGRRPQQHELVPVVMPAGSAVVYSGRLWHAAGENRTQTTRRALICEHVLPWLRPADNHILATGVEQLLSLTPELRRLAGVAPASKYLGVVAGQDPEQWLLQSNRSS